MIEQKVNGLLINKLDTNDDNPISLDEIEKGLWLGSAAAASDLETLKKHNITYILTVDSCPLPTSIRNNNNLTTKYIQISDVPKEDFINHFIDCCDFINEALNNGKVILVHCYFGMSRSATVVIAYFMKKYKLKFREALERVKIKRKYVHPNVGFIKQLKLFYRMGWKIDKDYPVYKLYRLRLAADCVKKAKILPQMYMDLVRPDPGLIQIRPEPNVFRCRKCRRIVACKTNLLIHNTKTNDNDDDTNDNNKEINNSKEDMDKVPPSQEKSIIITTETITRTDENILAGTQKAHDKKIDALLCGTLSNLSTNSPSCDNSDKNNKTITNNNICKEIYFIEPIGWMQNIFKNTQGKLNCPKCSNKLGNYSWVMGCKCPCGVQVSPAFYLVPSKVELSNIVQNVQSTI